MSKRKPIIRRDPWLIVVGRNLRQQRIDAGLTQERLAEKADLAPRTVQKIEAGQITILITTLRRLCRVMNCSYDQLLKE